jgi:hypothetical protein
MDLNRSTEDCPQSCPRRTVRRRKTSGTESTIWARCTGSTALGPTRSTRRIMCPAHPPMADAGCEITDHYPKDIERQVGDISLRASLTLGIGIAEWLLWRLDGRSAYNRVHLYIDALWARTVDKLYLKVSHLERPKDVGDPVVGPLLALELALYGVLVKTTLDHPERGKSVAEVVSLVRYTLTDPSEFERWLSSTLARFTDHFQGESEESWRRLRASRFSGSQCRRRRKPGCPSSRRATSQH